MLRVPAGSMGEYIGEMPRDIFVIWRRVLLLLVTLLVLPWHYGHFHVLVDVSNSKKMPYLNFPCLHKSEHQKSTL